MLDFYCAERRIAVEVDGWSHNMGEPGRDERRDAHLLSASVRTLRFPADLVLRDIEEVIDTILAECRRD